MRPSITLVSFAFLCSVAGAAEPDPPYLPNELQYLPVLRGELQAYWPEIWPRSHFAAQVQQETCYGIKGKKCWSPNAELKTPSEYGVGLGQITVTPRFNNFEEARRLHPSLKDWTWDNRYNAQYQLRALVLTNKFNNGKLPWAANPTERLALGFAAYNGGLGGVLSDRTVCKTTPGCDDTRWFGNIERTSRKAKVAAEGYGQSFFTINRGYVQHIMIDYPSRYRPFFGE